MKANLKNLVLPRPLVFDVLQTHYTNHFQMLRLEKVYKVTSCEKRMTVTLNLRNPIANKSTYAMV